VCLCRGITGPGISNSQLCPVRPTRQPTALVAAAHMWRILRRVQDADCCCKSRVDQCSCPVSQPEIELIAIDDDRPVVWPHGRGEIEMPQLTQSIYPSPCTLCCAARRVVFEIGAIDPDGEASATEATDAETCSRSGVDWTCTTGIPMERAACRHGKELLRHRLPFRGDVGCRHPHAERRTLQGTGARPVPDIPAVHRRRTRSATPSSGGSSTGSESGWDAGVHWIESCSVICMAASPQVTPIHISLGTPWLRDDTPSHVHHEGAKCWPFNVRAASGWVKVCVGAGRRTGSRARGCQVWRTRISAGVWAVFSHRVTCIFITVAAGSANSAITAPTGYTDAIHLGS